MTAPRKPVAWGVRSIHAEKSDLWMCDFGLATARKENADGFCAWANEHRAKDGPFEVVEFFDARADLQPLWALVEKLSAERKQARRDVYEACAIGGMHESELFQLKASVLEMAETELRATLEAMQ